MDRHRVLFYQDPDSKAKGTHSQEWRLCCHCSISEDVETLSGRRSGSRGVVLVNNLSFGPLKQTG
jgi:hypothetical protein